jgi:hypothetical protein
MEPGEAPPDPEQASERYFCPFPGCKRSFAELWRLKVHYRCVGTLLQQNLQGIESKKALELPYGHI